MKKIIIYALLSLAAIGFTCTAFAQAQPAGCIQYRVNSVKTDCSVLSQYSSLIGLSNATPSETFHIGSSASGNGGIQMDKSTALINFTSGGGTIKQSNGGWIKINGANATGDLSGTNGNDFRIFTEGDGITGKGFYLKAHRDASGGGSDWPVIIKVLNQAAGGAYPNLFLVPEGGVVNLGSPPVYATNAAAITGGLVVGDVFMDATGLLHIVY